ncbi:MAG: tRNA (N(6)-L-threonylcarbamoyladenosine(37)-C(2))-methylthiotransferase MtaB [Sphingobacteriia bacterium]|nr:tRNA (N(6)-L-threonylcarbamoyladenosine(37)-C(2))-methylthiotransferase MtaB [Sphingobacteriia bacterium]
MNKPEIVTFGCRLNAYESEVIKEGLEGKLDEKVIIFNTCAVTKEAERQAQQAIRKFRRENPEHKIIVTGCAAQVNPKKYASMNEVDLVLGNEEKLKTDSYFSLPEDKTLVNDIMSIKETASHLIQSFDGRARSFIQVQNGCDHRCTYCMIPFGRGNSRSVPIGEIVNQIRQLVVNGFKEIVLTGVDITSYGPDLPGTPTLGQMIKRVLTLVPELPRLRLSSIDVAEIDEDLFHLICYEPRFMPHIHISLQAGDNLILKRMKRRHTREQVIEFCNKVRKIRPEIIFGADLIAGFPTETDEMFENTLNLVHEANLTHLHVFPYSEREGTPAAKMPQLPKKVRKERAKLLREAGEKELAKILPHYIGQKMQILVESNEQAKTENFLSVMLPKTYPSGTLLEAEILSIKNNMLVAV